MHASRLVARGLRYYWRTNAAVVLGVATAVAVLAGALLVGDSVRGSLRDLVIQRLGRADLAVLSSAFFREALADGVRSDPAFGGSFDAISPLIVLPGLVTDQAGGRRASRVQVYGVDDRFWRFHGVAAVSGPSGRDAFVNRALADEINTAVGATVLVRVERPASIPIESLHGRKDNVGRTVRLTVRAVAGAREIGDFSLQAEQRAVRTVFVPLRRLQQDLDVNDRVNALLVSTRRTAPGAPERSSQNVRSLQDVIRRQFAFEDVGLSIRVVTPSDIGSGGPSHLVAGTRPSRGPVSAPSRPAPRSDQSSSMLIVESAAGLLDDPRARAAEAAAADAGLRPQPVFSYLANSLRSGDRQVPYSLVTAMDLRIVAPDVRFDVSETPPPIVLNTWAARDLGVRAGDPLTLDYYVWEEPGRLLTRTAAFTIAGVVPIEGAAADRNLVPVYPGITEAQTLGDWDPPFPIDLTRVRPVDEDYWDRYRTTPKAFVPLEVGQRLWGSRFGDRTSIRLPLNRENLANLANLANPANPAKPANPENSRIRDRYAASLRAKLDPLALGLAIRDVRAAGLTASRGATDFGEYFTYFSFFLVVSALMLAALFFRLGVEQRSREVGLLRSVGFADARVRRLFLAEGLVLASFGAALGAAGAIGYAAAMMAGLRGWWSGAVGTRALTLHVAQASLAVGAVAALVAAMVCIWWTLRGLARLSERSLLAGDLGSKSELGAALSASTVRPGIRLARVPSLYAAVAFAMLGTTLVALSFAGTLDRTGGFFGAGSSLLVACLCAARFTLCRPRRSALGGHGWRPVWTIGIRNAADRPGRSMLAMGVIAAATFILIAVGAFRREQTPALDRHSGTGGYPLLVDLLLPIAIDPNSRDGREMLGIPNVDHVAIEPFRVLPGDDASCLNLYEPGSPRVLGVSRPFVESGRFAFQASTASTEAERANPWLLLNRDLGPDIVPVAGDANSITYVLHKQVGDEVVIARGDRPVRLRIVAALADSIFQGELLMAEANFTRLFPEEEGYRFLLVDAPAPRAAAVANAIEEGAGDLGADAVSTAARLAEFQTVENTYLSTFQSLGGLGLLLGTVGLAAVVLRNVLERRRELALLGAVGYEPAHMFVIVVAENLLLLAWGLGIGTACALVAIAPAAIERGGRLPVTGSGALLVVAVLVAGLLSSVVATRAALRTPLLAALRSE
jgi:putative ABC transport system permease protein